ncbi:right-handed parallel beta-helix repeat-containing protein [Pseudonocardia sp.]|uniref:right-handed parallel beta-helix repeat-containing protein n=1 Tax=Pseudonocardia sp. TaxID=60912 RepID=UPI0025F39B32|nr:right-handed parallel beta-helix repeat-containing protein [Pseudonocardia sp.]
MAPGPTTAPPGAVVVDPTVDADLRAKTDANPPGTTFWLAPGIHRLGTDQFGQAEPKDGDVYLGAPGAIVDGRGQNLYAFIGTATNVTIAHLTVRGFIPPQDQGVVNHDSGNGWIIEDNTIENNKGAAVMAGAHQQLLRNCLRANGQYGLNAYQPGNGIVGLVVEGNEITGNNADDWENRRPGCGCSGGAKFWSVNGADIRGNWVHDNRGVALWADTNDNDFLIENNIVENNDGEAVFYETSYNLILRNNILRNNAMVSGKGFAAKKDTFPEAAVYLSESGGDARLKARTAKIEIYGNSFDGNWSGITAWENADRFCNSPANTSTGVCTPFVPKTSECTQPGIAKPPLYDDCRWKTQNVDIHDNTFTAATTVCAPGFASRMAILSNFGTYPDWSPYKGYAIQKAITGDQHLLWHDNLYTGNWTFVTGDVANATSVKGWQAAPLAQDRGSTFAAARTAPTC